MFQSLRGAVEALLAPFDQRARLGQVKDDFSGLKYSCSEDVGLRVSIIPSLVPEVPHATGSGMHVSLDAPFVVERIERVPSGKILKTRQVLDAPARERLVEELRHISKSGQPESLPDLSTLCAER